MVGFPNLIQVDYLNLLALADNYLIILSLALRHSTVDVLAPVYYFLSWQWIFWSTPKTFVNQLHTISWTHVRLHSLILWILVELPSQSYHIMVWLSSTQYYNHIFHVTHPYKWPKLWEAHLYSVMSLIALVVSRTLLFIVAFIRYIFNWEVHQ